MPDNRKYVDRREALIKAVAKRRSIVQKELDKCVLLCANCDREVESGITQLSIEK